MRLPRRGSHDATKKNHIRLNNPGKYDNEKGLIQHTPLSPMPKQQESRPAEPVRSGPPKVLRRQDYADVYTIGRKASSAQPPLGRTGSSIAFGGFSAGTAVAYRGQARRLRVNPRLLLMVAFAAVLTVAVVFGVSALAGGHASAKGQQVLFDGRMLCIAQSQDAVEKALVQIQTDLKNTYGMDTQRPASLTYAPVTCDSQNICTDAQIKQVLKDNMDIKVMASVIRVNDRPAVALKSAGEAQQALDAVLAPFQTTTQNARTDIAFVENVQIQQLPIDYGLVQPLEGAVRTLTLGTNVEDNL
jgi:hypothetical protein